LPSAALIYTVGMQPAVDQAIIASLQQGAWNAVLRVVILGLFVATMVTGFAGKTRLFCYTAPTFVAVLIVLCAFTNRHPRCSLCGSKLSKFNRSYAREDYHRIMSSAGSPRHLRLMAWDVPAQASHRMIQGYECFHCRKMAILG
jgi:hypothetical protein